MSTDVPGQTVFSQSQYTEIVVQRNELANENERLRKQIRDLKATLDESASNGGTWPV